MIPCPLGCIEAHDHISDPENPDSLSGLSNEPQAIDFDSPSYPLPGRQTEATGDPGRTTSGDQQTIRVRLQLQGEWKFVRGEWFPSQGLVVVYGNGGMELDQGHASNLDEAVGVVTAVCYEQFRES